MTMGTRLHRWSAVLPGVVLSATLLLVVSAMLPAMLGGLLLFAYPTLAVVLALGKGERVAVKVLGRARRATPGEEELLAGIAGRLGDGGWDVPELYVARGDGGRAAVEPYGRCSVIVAPRLLGWVSLEEISQTVAAAVVAQAAASLRVGPSRFDLSVRLLTAPGDLMVAGFSRIAQLFTWLPGVLALWRIRAVFGVVAVWQCLQAHQATVAITTAVLVAVSYTGPASARAWRCRVQTDADRLVAEAGLADQLEFAVRSAGGPGSLDRAQRIRRVSHDTRYEAPASSRRFYIVR